MAKPTKNQIKKAYYIQLMARLDYLDNSGASNSDEFYVDYENKYNTYKKLHEAYHGTTT